MSRLIVILTLLLLTVFSAAAQEQVTLSTPIQVDAGATQFRPSQLVLNFRAATILIVLDEAPGGVFATAPGSKQLVVTYEGPVATTIMLGLNKANLTTRSLNQRILDRVLADGKVPPGTVLGTVQ